MNEHGLGRELEALRRRIGPALCSDPAPCMMGVSTELILRGDGTQGRIGQAPPPLCEACPERESRRPRVRHIEVVRDLRNRHGYEHPPSAARMPPVGPDGDEREHDTSASTVAPTEPDDGLAFPPSWPADHPARLAAKGQEPPQRPRGRGNDETIRIDPRDFGL